jgi:hypothetical protein
MQIGVILMTSGVREQCCIFDGELVEVVGVETGNFAGVKGSTESSSDIVILVMDFGCVTQIADAEGM